VRGGMAAQGGEAAAGSGAKSSEVRFRCPCTELRRHLLPRCSFPGLACDSVCSWRGLRIEMQMGSAGCLLTSITVSAFRFAVGIFRSTSATWIACYTSWLKWYSSSIQYLALLISLPQKCSKFNNRKNQLSLMRQTAIVIKPSWYLVRITQ
jgi:hypothetical protein